MGTALPKNQWKGKAACQFIKLESGMLILRLHCSDRSICVGQVTETQTDRLVLNLDA